MSKLATIQRISDFKKHPNADRLNLAKILGWQCVTAENYEVGDFIIYIQIDSTVPQTDWSEFLFKGDEERARIRSIKLRGEISQGLILPLSVLGWNIRKEDGKYVYRVMNGYNELFEGQDVTSDLGVEKYSKPIPPSLSGEVAGDFPSHLVPKTDEERVQSIPEILKEMKYKSYYISKKMDGCCDENTVVHTEDGDKTIKEVCESQYPGKVLCYDIYEKKSVFSKITNWFIKENNDDWYELETEDGDIVRLTGNHPVFLPDLNCYRRVDQLLGNENLLIS